MKKKVIFHISNINLKKFDIMRKKFIRHIQEVPYKY